MDASAKACWKPSRAAAIRFAAIKDVISWDTFAESVTEAQKLAQPEDFDFLHRTGESYDMLRRYAPEFLAVLKLRAAPAAKDVLEGIEGFTDHMFGLMHLLGFRFAPRIRDLRDTKLFIAKGEASYDALKPMISSN